MKIRTKTAILALIMLFAFNNTKAVENSKQPSIQEILIQGSIGCLVATAIMYQCNNSFKPFPNYKGIFISYGIDPKMLYQGGYDMTTKVGYEGKKYEVFLQNEYFSALDD